jgi:Flp pilus assembly CpaF family ATPase
VRSVCPGREKELLKEITYGSDDALSFSFASLDRPGGLPETKGTGNNQGIRIRLSVLSMEKIMYYVTRDLIGFGRLDPILRDKNAEDISADGVVGYSGICLAHRSIGSLETNDCFAQEELDSIIYKLARDQEEYSWQSPLLDAFATQPMTGCN